MVQSRGHAEWIRTMLIDHVILAQFVLPDGTCVGKQPDYQKRLKKSGSPVTFLQDILHRDSQLPDGAVLHLFLVPAGKQQLLRKLLTKYCDVFLSELPLKYPPDRGLGDAHYIPLLENSDPIRKKMYRYSPQEQLLIKQQIANLLEQGAIQPLSSPWVAPVLFVK